ncbi:bifunctional [glutamine synthetase] adenylyltransferase/[glutamine synthetase]-adenylyl-L-tyrosine phosphorylase [Arsenicicoccus piscis]|uniref:Bifunctional glutamine synthetase adenylyltransferase/adenylyl-removing enzyme n=1 Tax=Arsenicicoccus piscis TaxID=673954 RepID=A0ABQ6HQP4_9MICO|nr:bifunctional [glutamine synthetase] adenylyltransferase/[glutamine synthetase]-adenylyl-L-tyrosine phosphorylase [Arsenicicoccus piscis]MCH8628462.1 bifunctional [glutamine synthetase] adenylyltransferase/[glutamine synthetase]-adenylyl-L-tyrosine phosphorylase [Arsenicicoccus piscis]GMA19973.1 glutamate-ammonia-ligase adenylyltransferase [Arsenicicoccus piscis]
MPNPRTSTAHAALARLGFHDPARAERFLRDPCLAGLALEGEDVVVGGLAQALGAVADPDLALLALVRLMEGLQRSSGSHLSALTDALARPGVARDRLLAVMGASTALADHLAAHPEHWSSAADARRLSDRELTAVLVDAVTGRETAAALDALRVAYRRELIGIAALDLTAPSPVDALPDTARSLADLAAAALEAAWVIGRAEVGPDADSVRLSVIGMGKCGGRELNYVSDVDVIFVCEPVGHPGDADGPTDAAGDVDGDAEARAMTVGTHWASAIMRACATATAEGTLWPVDAALRPEGKQGPLVRTVRSHKSYYERWAKTWEFQALLKARHVAGDRELSERYLDEITPMVWQASARENFVEDVQAMRRRVEQHVPAREAERQLKLGPGGLRDVEFSVQLLQLVHGRSDDSLRSRTTLDALAALADGGYIGREDAAVLDEAYRFLRAMEHRIQLHRLRRTHLVPTSDDELRRLGRSMGLTSEPDKAIVEQWQRRAREVRSLHQRLFYRPLLSAVARLGADELRLTPAAAEERLAALGFRDPKGALRHIEALTDGVSRTAAIQRTLLPVMLGWFASGADPDAGLLAFRKVSDELGTVPWYLKMLRDEGDAAERLAHVLSSSRFAAQLLERSPTSAQILGLPGGLRRRTRDQLDATMAAALARYDSPAEAFEAVRTVRRQELFRVIVMDVVDLLDLEEVGHALTDIAASTIGAALQLATRAVETELGEPLGTALMVVGMGRLGGGEMSYASDADVMLVHDPGPSSDGDSEHDPRPDDAELQRRASLVVQELRRLLAISGPEPALGLDVDLRPEGKNGPLVRSLDSYRSYYERWAATWERQALVRAAPVAGDPDLAAAFVALIDPLRYPADGLTSHELRDIRRLKARMESERLPRGADRRTHLKLGTGGLSDVEWTVQVLQLQHAHEVPGLRTTSTLPALRAACEAGLVTTEQAQELTAAWSMASAIRDAGMVWRGRAMESVPSDLRDADGVGRLIGRAPGEGQAMVDAYLRSARHARAVVDELFYGDTPR